MLWASLAVGLVKVLIDFYNLSNLATPAFTNFVLIGTFAVIAFLIFKISAGRNWARITLLLSFLLGVVPAVFDFPDEFSRVPVVGALSVIQLGLQACSLFLLFKQPGTTWFRNSAGDRDIRGERLMALVKCRECGRDVSTEAAACPNCGAKPAPAPKPARGL